MAVLHAHPFLNISINTLVNEAHCVKVLDPDGSSAQWHWTSLFFQNRKVSKSFETEYSATWRRDLLSRLSVHFHLCYVQCAIAHLQGLQANIFFIGLNKTRINSWVILLQTQMVMTESDTSGIFFSLLQVKRPFREKGERGGEHISFPEELSLPTALTWRPNTLKKPLSWSGDPIKYL